MKAFYVNENTHFESSKLVGQRLIAQAASGGDKPTRHVIKLNTDKKEDPDGR